MTTYKKSTTQGVWKDQILFQRLTTEFQIPPEVVDKGITAIIDWINEAKTALPKVGTIAIGALILSAMAKMSTLPRTSINIKSTMMKRDFLLGLMPFGTIPYIGSVINETFLVVKEGTSSSTEIPTSIIDSMITLGGNSFSFSYMDGTQTQGLLKTDPILFRHQRLFGGPEIVKVKPSHVKSIEGKITTDISHDNPPQLTTLLKP